MKKTYILSLVILMLSYIMSAQETITLQFTSHLQNGSYKHFDCVYVSDSTNNWIDAIYYPDTTMVLTTNDGICEWGEGEGFLSEPYPNPFSGYTNVMCCIEKSQHVNAQLFLINGEMLTEFDGIIDRGTYAFAIEMDRPQLALFVVTSGKNKCVKKVYNTAYGNGNKIEVNKLYNSIPERHIHVGDFSIGDLMKYEAVIYDDDYRISNTISQNQFNDEVIEFTFDINEPIVTTSNITNITSTTVTGGGTVISDGGASIQYRGVCWSTNHNPTINDNYTINGAGSGDFYAQLTGLSINTTYYVRSYAVNVAGVGYGNEVCFTTPPMSDIKILSIGNSYSLDALAYVPFILENMNVDANIQIGILYQGGASLSTHVNNFENQSSDYTYFLYNGGGEWQNLGQHSIQFTIDNYDWDIIILQQVSHQAWNWLTYQPNLNILTSLIDDYIDYPMKFGWYMVQSRAAMGVDGSNYNDETIEAHYANIASNAQRLLDETVCEFVIPVGTAIQNARTISSIKALGDYADSNENTSGFGYLEYDGIHLQEGLPCQIAAYTFVLSILEQYGGLEAYSIIGESTRVTSEWIAEKNIPGINGIPVGSDDTNCPIGQQCAIEAFNNPYEITNMNK